MNRKRDARSSTRREMCGLGPSPRSAAGGAHRGTRRRSRDGPPVGLGGRRRGDHGLQAPGLPPQPATGSPDAGRPADSRRRHGDDEGDRRPARHRDTRHRLTPAHHGSAAPQAQHHRRCTLVAATGPVVTLQAGLPLLTCARAQLGHVERDRRAAPLPIDARDHRIGGKGGGSAGSSSQPSISGWIVQTFSGRCWRSWTARCSGLMAPT